MTFSWTILHFENGSGIKLFVSLILLCFFLNLLEISAENLIEKNSAGSNNYPVFLYHEKDYYRSISEILKLKFENENYDRILDLYLLKNYYQLNNHYQLQLTAEKLLKERKSLQHRPYQNEIKRLLSISFLQSGKEDMGKATWDECCLGDGVNLFPMSVNIPDQIDPERARLFSSIIPGSGFLLSGSYSKAVVSFLLNSAFIYGCYQYASKDQPGIAGLLLFFEIGWYVGGRNASYEAAINYNRMLITNYQQQWINSNLKPVF
ncbi:hypothetical protein KJ966_10930 [bacterium]|nr:hypothetical protein [bacterium]